MTRNEDTFPTIEDIPAFLRAKPVANDEPPPAPPRLNVALMVAAGTITTGRRS
jgi:hypothetical protein